MYRIGQEELAEIEKLFKTRKLFRSDTDLHEIENFEKEWAAKIGVKHALCVTGGTTALICGLVGLGIGPGDEVIVPGYTFMASALAVLAVGAIPVIAEIDETLTIDPDDMEDKIGPHTRAIMPVHMVGCPADMARIASIARKRGMKVIEDACQADGGSFRGKPLGAWGQVGAHSFNFYKIITAGEGGAVVTDDDTIYERAMIQHDGGISFRESSQSLTTPIFIGQQYRMSEVLGAMLRVQLSRLDGIIADLRRVKRALVDRIPSVPGVRLLRSNDSEGECGQVLGFLFDNETLARAFATAEGVAGQVPIDWIKHVYSNWTPIIEKRGAHHPALDPFRLPENRGLRMEYTRDMCPRTLDILRRTVLVWPNPDWAEPDIEKCARTIGAALHRIFQ